MALSMVALGLYIAASLLMQHSIGPQLFQLSRARGPRLRLGRFADGACCQRREMMYLGLSLTSAGTLLMLGLLFFWPG